jgi:hypothetical protein
MDQSADDPMDFIAPGHIYQEPPPPTKPLHGSRPTGTIFTVFLFLKITPFFLYVFGWLLIPWTIFQWVFTIISIAADFWFTKNVAGRLILGMRWSSKVTEGGETQWLFEYIEGGVQGKGPQRRMFWLLLAGGTALWALWGFFALIKLSFGWLFVAIIGLSLSSSNAFGYWNCEKTIAGGIGNLATDFVTQNLVQFARAKAADLIRGAGDLPVNTEV